MNAAPASSAASVLQPHSAPTPRAAVYRADIDGLRALAVTAVVLFHARLQCAPGGFIGVDVFFVISGYLITRSIDDDIRRGRFSAMRFYERRIRRLFPALFAMLAACLATGAILLLPNDFEKVGRNAAGAAMFVSNIFLWLQGGYFEATGPRPLLHTWSLAIEEQFYLLLPPVMVLLHRRSARSVMPVLATLALASLGASIVSLRVEPSAAFYLPQYRIWELLGGSLLALGLFPRLPGARAAALAALTGVSLIVVATIGYNETVAFPGAAAVLPCLGTMLVIHAGEHTGTPVGRLLAARPLVFVGRISYSVYLWHWPLIVFFTYYNIDEPSLAQRLLLIAGSFALGAVSWRFIELPFRRPPATAPAAPAARVLLPALAAIVAVATVGTLVYVAHGFPDRFAPSVDAMSDYATSQNPEADECGATALQLAPRSRCTIGDPTHARLFLWGDSHAGALYGALREIARTGPATVYGATPRCPPLIGFGTDADCIAGNQRRLEYVLAHPEIRTVIIAARWSLYSRGRATNSGPAENNAELPELQDTSGRQYPQFTTAAGDALRDGLYTLVERLLAAGKRVVLVYPVPEMGYDIPSTIARLTAEGRRPTDFGLAEQRYIHRQRYAIPMLNGLGRRPGLTRIYPERTLCPADRCLGYAHGQPLYFDSHHLSIPGSRLLVPALTQAVIYPAEPTPSSGATRARRSKSQDAAQPVASTATRAGSADVDGHLRQRTARALLSR